MPAAFGFSVGDFIAVLQLVCILINSLRNVSSSGVSYQALLNELYALETALLNVKRVDPEYYGTVKVNSLRQAASQCQHTINEFWGKVQKYQPHLQHGRTKSKIKDAWYKLKWALCKEDDLEKFRAEIRGHTSSINILLSTMQLEAMALDSRTRDSHHTNLASIIHQQTYGIMQKLSAVATTGEEHVQQAKELLETSSQIMQSNLRLFQAVHDLQLSVLGLPGQILRQQPVYLTDALNKECPFHLEFVRSTRGLFEVLKDNLKETGCGPEMIERGQFVIEERGTHRAIDFSLPWERCVQPGQRLVMSMVFEGRGQLEPICPRCKTRCEESVQETTCGACGAIFRRVDEVDPDESEKRASNVLGQSPSYAGGTAVHSSGNPRKRKRKRENNENLSDARKFRRIRVIHRVEMSGSSAQSGGLKDDPWMMDASDRLTETRVLHKPLANDREMEPAPVESPGNKQHFARKADDAGHRARQVGNACGEDGESVTVDDLPSSLEIPIFITHGYGDSSFALESDFGSPYAMPDSFTTWLFEPHGGTSDSADESSALWPRGDQRMGRKYAA